MAKMKIVTMESLEDAPIDEIVEMEAGGNDHVCNLTEGSEHVRRIEELSAGIDEGREVIATLESINKFIDGAKLSPSSIRVINPALTHMLKRIGYKKHTKISLEAFGKVCSREDGTKLVMEFLVDAIVWIWEAIVNAFKKLWEWITDFFSWLFGSSKKEEARVTSAIKEAEAAEKVIKEETKKNKLLGPFDEYIEILLPESPYSLYLNVPNLEVEMDIFLQEVPVIFKGLDDIFKHAGELHTALNLNLSSDLRAEKLAIIHVNILRIIMGSFITGKNVEDIEKRFPQLDLDNTEEIKYSDKTGGMAVYPFNKFGLIVGDISGLSETETINKAAEETKKINTPDANGLAPSNIIVIEPIYYCKPTVKSKFTPNNGRDVYVPLPAMFNDIADANLHLIQKAEISNGIDKLSKKINKIQSDFTAAFNKIDSKEVITKPDLKSYGEASQNLIQNILTLTTNITSYINTTSSHLTTYCNESTRARLKYTIDWKQQQMDNIPAQLSPSP